MKKIKSKKNLIGTDHLENLHVHDNNRMSVKEIRFQFVDWTQVALDRNH